MNDRENRLRTIRFEKPEYIPAKVFMNGSCWLDSLMTAIEKHCFSA
jgi:hypothetical protein